MKTFLSTFLAVFLSVGLLWVIHTEKQKIADRKAAVLATADDGMALLDQLYGLCSSGTTENSIDLYKRQIVYLRQLAAQPNMPAEKRAEILRGADGSLADLRKIVGPYWVKELKNLTP